MVRTSARTLMSGTVTVLVAVSAGIDRGLLRWESRLRCRNPRPPSIAFASFNDLVELASVEPDPAALRAIVNLDVLAGAHRELGVFADRALHGAHPLNRNLLIGRRRVEQVQSDLGARLRQAELRSPPPEFIGHAAPL